MAQPAIFVYKPIGSLEAKAGSIYTSANIPSVADVVVLLLGVRITDKTGANTPHRGVRMTITNNESPAITPLPNVPFVWKEGEPILFDPDYSYSFQDDAIISYGIQVAV